MRINKYNCLSPKVLVAALTFLSGVTMVLGYVAFGQHYNMLFKPKFKQTVVACGMSDTYSFSSSAYESFNGARVYQDYYYRISSVAEAQKVHQGEIADGEIVKRDAEFDLQGNVVKERVVVKFADKTRVVNLEIKECPETTEYWVMCWGNTVTSFKSTSETNVLAFEKQVEEEVKEHNATR